MVESALAHAEGATLPRHARPAPARTLAVLTAGILGMSGIALAPAAAVADPEFADQVVPAGLRVNEVESKDPDGGADWIELYNPEASEIALGGYVLRDNKDANAFAIPDGTTIAAGGYLVFEELVKGAAPDAVGFDFGLGDGDSVRLYDPSGALVQSFTWGPHAEHTYGVTDAGAWASTSAATPGAANVFADDGTGAAPTSDVRLNEVDSGPADWVELVNVGTAEIDLSGFELRDNSDDHRWFFPAGAGIAPGEFLVVDADAVGVVDRPAAEGGESGTFAAAIGIGSADEIRLFDPTGSLVDRTGAWTEHAAIRGDEAAATLARCTDGEGEFRIAHATPGETNRCATDEELEEEPAPEFDTVAWPGGADVRAVDGAGMLLEDSSGLDAQETADGVVLWAVDNGTGTFWKLDAAADGSVAFADGWEDGKRARFPKDAENPAAAGPDTEGITVAGDGLLYLASERDNGDKGVNRNSVLQIDPEAPGPDVVASMEWDLTAALPQVSANTGVEAVEWIPDADLAGVVTDASTGEAYNPADYPQHGDGLFVVAVEDGGQLFGFALNSDGGFDLVFEIDPGLPGVMALDYDTVLGGLWAVCDDGCGNVAAFVELGAAPTVTHVAPPASLASDQNFEGFATAPASLVTPAGAGAASGAGAAAVTADALMSDPTATRPAWRALDGVTTGALVAGTVNAAPVGAGGDEDGDEDGGSDGAEDSGAAASGTAEAGAAGAGSDGAGADGADSAADSATGGALATTGGDPAVWVALAVTLLGLGGAAMLARAARRRALR